MDVTGIPGQTLPEQLQFIARWLNRLAVQQNQHAMLLRDLEARMKALEQK